MKTITIEIDDDDQTTVSVDDGMQHAETQQFESAQEGLAFVQSVISEEAGEPAGEAEPGESSENYGQMWRQEANKRGKMRAGPGY